MIKVGSEIYSHNNNDRFVEANDFVIDEESEFTHESIVVNNERVRKTINLDQDYSAYISDDFRVVHELSTVDVKTNNWKGALVSILVIILLSSAILLAIYFISPDIKNILNEEPKERLKLNEFLDGSYNEEPTFNGTWISDTEISYINSNGDFVKYDINSENITVIIYARIMKQYEVDRAILSPNHQFVLLISHTKEIFRHSTLAQYKIFHLSNNSIIDLKPDEANVNAYLQAAEWGPKEAQLTFVYKNNIYYMPEPDLKRIKRLTNDDDRFVYNGIPDWLYEEEILGSSTAFWWSKDGTRLAFAQFNDTEVELQEYPRYGTLDLSSQYSPKVQIKYPKPGHKNPSIKLFVVILDSINDVDAVENHYYHQLNPIHVRPPAYLSDKDHYLTAVVWADQRCLITVWMNRAQNYSSYASCSPSFDQPNEWQCNDNFIRKLDYGWIEMSSVFVDPNGLNYYLLAGDQTSKRNVQILKINIKTGLQKYLTFGHYDVTRIVDIVENMNKPETSIVYYMATGVNKPGERHAYKLVDYGLKDPSTNNTIGQQINKPICLTCNQTNFQCLSNRIRLSKNGNHFVHECLGPDIPSSFIRKSEENSFQHWNRTWETNAKLKLLLSTKLLPTIKTELINRTDYALVVQMFIPPSFRQNRIVKYPLIVKVYGGPGSQMVSENFKIDYGKYLASGRDIIYAAIDGRGSGCQGDTHKYQLYHKLGTVEIEDQIIVAKYLMDKYNFINKDAVGIWGWSYGGYATAMVLAKDSADPVFKCGISVAPVTSWLLYDSCYTERYMGLLTNDTLKDYFKSDIMHQVESFKGKKYLLIHGTADDNVHIQNSMMLIKELNKANILYQTQIYPDENHALKYVTAHLYSTMENFWNDCFQPNYYAEEIGLRRRRISKIDKLLSINV